MKLRKKLSARKATWLAFGLVALAGLASALDDPTQNAISRLSDAPPTDSKSETRHPAPSDRPAIESDNKNALEFDQAAEALRAYKQAISTLSTLTAPSTSPIHPSLASNANANSILSSFFPNLQGQGPLGSAIRIIVKLHQQSWLRRITSGFGKAGLGMGGSRKKEEELRGKAVKVIDLLQHSAEMGHSDALYTLAQISLFPPNNYFPSEPKLAFDSLSTHALLTGNASSQSLLAFFHATGYREIVPVDQAKAQLYYTFAAQGGNKGAQMALGYRYWSGIGTLEDCGRAVEWYQSASEQAMEDFLSGPPGGRTLPLTATRLSDLVGGVYGPGASVASTGLNALRPAIKAGVARAAGETWEDLLEYYLFNAERGETGFAYRLGKIFYQGSIYAGGGGIASGSEGVGAVPRDFASARYYFLRVARPLWPRDPPNPLQYTPSKLKDDNQTPVIYAAESAAYLGRMYLRGEGVKVDVATAKMWFERGAAYGDPECHNGLGIIYRDGLLNGMKPDMKKALAHFGAAVVQELAEAHINIGKHYYQHAELKLATNHFESAIRYGSPFEAYYYLAEIHAAQVKTPGIPPHVASSSCAMAVSFHKIVSERGAWDDDLLRDAEVAWSSGTEKGTEMAMLKWWIAAERGSEIAQNNLAYIWDQDKSILRPTRFSPVTPSEDTAKLALTQWTRAAAQRNIDALVKVGDYYYHGLGVREDPEWTRFEKAAGYYQSAADTQMSALAMWNLGWMYENGVGVPQDFHLAKRHYDRALETNPDAHLPVLLSLGKLYVRSVWHTLMGGKGGLNIWSLDNDDPLDVPPRPTDDRGLGEENNENHKIDSISEEERSSYDEEGPWYLGKAKEQFHKRRNEQLAGRRGDEEDPIQWAKDRRNGEHERDGDVGPDDFFEGAMRGGRRGEEEVDEFWETMLLVWLCLAVSVLLYVRTRMVDRVRRDQQPQQGGGENDQAQPPANGGLFPPPGDPARNEWAILR